MQLLRIPHYNYDNNNVSQVFHESSLALLSHFDRVIFTSRHDHQYRCPTLIVWVRWGGWEEGMAVSRVDTSILSRFHWMSFFTSARTTRVLFLLLV